MILKKCLLSFWLTAALWSEEGHAPALGTVWEERENAGRQKGRMQWNSGEKHWCQTEIPLGTLELCSISLHTFGRDELVSLFLGISSPVKTDKNVLTEKYFQCIGSCLFWLIAFIRERQIFFMHFKLYSFMHFIHFCSSGKEVIFYPSPAENIVVLTAKNRRNIFHFQTVFLISFHILLWQWKLEKDQSKINNNF